MPTILHQFAFSHFNEKARWALAHKGLAYQRETYLPGPHMPLIRKISGQTQTPVLQLDDEFIPGSADIIEALEKRHAGQPLYPAAAIQRDAALALQADYDARIGPAVRTLLFAAMIDHGEYLTRMFGHGKPWLKRVGYRLTLPLAKPLIARGNGVSVPGNVEKSAAIVSAGLDELAATVASTGYLVGDGFTVADLTAAALYAPIASVQHVDMARPHPIPESVAALVARYEAHPAIEWVNHIYTLHRS